MSTKKVVEAPELMRRETRPSRACAAVEAPTRAVQRTRPECPVRSWSRYAQSPCSDCLTQEFRENPYGPGNPPLKIKIMLESNPLKSRILVQRLAVASRPPAVAYVGPEPRTGGTARASGAA